MICLNMIVKDEAEIIRDTLDNVTSVMPITYWVIHDTGSQDGTAHIVEDFFREKNIPGRLVHQKWQSFGENRQMALEDARGTADFVLFFDADCRVEGKCPRLNPAVDSYAIMSWRGASSYPVKHIVRNDGRFRWRGVVHEGLYFSGANERAEMLDGLLVRNDSAGARSRDPATYYRDARLLSDAYDRISDPVFVGEDRDLLPRYAFYAANSWRDAGCPREAVEWYRRRIALGGWKDEVFVASRELGIALSKMGDLEGALCAWAEGHEICPDRAECLYKMAQLERERGRFQMALLYADAARRIPLPEEARLFLWPDVHRFWASFEWLWSLKHLNRLSEGAVALEDMKRNGAPDHLFPILGIVAV